MQSPTKTDLGEILLAALGVWFAVRAAAQLSGLASVSEELWEGGISFAYFLPFAVSGISGLFLVVFRRRLSAELFGLNQEGSTEQNARDTDLKPFLVSILGIWFVASGIVDAAQIESESLMYPAAELTESLFQGGPSRALITSDAWLARVPYLIEMIVGAALFLASDSLTELWLRLRRAGRER